MLSSRRETRILVVQTLFENDFNHKKITHENLRSTFVLLTKEKNSELIKDPFAKNLLEGISEHCPEIDKIIMKAAPDWPLEKLGTVDRNILRLGVYELLYGKKIDVPPRVALNEAIEITKAFLNDGARKFISGVLGNIYLQIQDPNAEEEFRKRMKQQKSVGGVIFRTDEEGEVHFAFVHDVFGKWTLSKGKLSDENEEYEEGLKRVIKGELGLDVEIPDEVEEIGMNSYIAHLPDGPVRKEVHYFLVRAESEELRLKESGGLEEARWFSHKEAERLNFYSDLKDIILKGMDIAEEMYGKK